MQVKEKDEKGNPASADLPFKEVTGLFVYLNSKPSIYSINKGGGAIDCSKHNSKLFTS